MRRTRQWEYPGGPGTAEPRMPAIAGSGRTLGTAGTGGTAGVGRAVTSVWLRIGAVAALCLTGCGEADGDVRNGRASSGAEVAGAPSDAAAQEASSDAGVEDVEVTEEDWAILRQKVEWARSRGLDTVPVGEAVARLGATFVGTPYRPATLEVPGPERLVVNLRELDCVTFVESVLAIVHVVRTSPPGEPLAGPYVEALTRIRYRGGVLDGYGSRLHYFSEWIRDGEAKGVVRDVTAELGGASDPEPVNFMSSNPDAYRQLADDSVLEVIRAMEASVSETPRAWIPQDRIAATSEEIRSGDVIAATSTVPGLDVAHTGLAYWKEDALHLLHAPLVGDSVEISERPLHDRIQGIDGQDGILVARPAAGTGAP